jgi:hypothetical protein
MNTAMLHGARPGDRSTAKTGSMGFKRAAAMAKRMGIDLTKLGSQVKRDFCASCTAHHCGERMFVSIYKSIEK